MRKLVLTGGLIALVATACHAQAAGKLSQECRREVVKMCGFNRGKIRECLMEKKDELSEPCAQEIVAMARGKAGDAEKEARKNGDKQLVAMGGVEYAYRNGPLEKLDFYKAEKRDAPLIVFVHGGGWKRGDKRNATGTAKVTHFREQGYAFATINYPLVPESTVEQQATDVAAAIAYLKSNAAKLGFDPNRIVLMGHSAGAHLSALVGTDPQYLRKAGLSFSDLRGVVPLDGAAYDVQSQMGENAMLMGDTYKQAFGTDPARQQALSPTFHAQGENAPSFLILHVDREDGKRQSEGLAEALRQAGTKVQLNAFAGKGLKGHAEINRKLGEADYPATPIVDAWLKAVFGS